MAPREVGAISIRYPVGDRRYRDRYSWPVSGNFRENRLLRLGIERALEIISEASRYIPDDLLILAPDIPWRQIRGVGNILRHEYHNSADEIVWSVVTENLGPLKVAILKLSDNVRYP